MNINQYLDATYLKTAHQANISEKENQEKVVALINEAILYNYKLVMILPKYISTAKEIIKKAKKRILVGTVIDFPNGTNSIHKKLEEVQQAIHLGADELDVVVNYQAFKKGEIETVKNQIIQITKRCLENNKVIKWIIEVAALTNKEIIVISQLVKNVVFEYFGEDKANSVFVKSSTGFFKTKNNLPSGATFGTMKLIVDNAKPIQIKAAGGVRDYKTSLKMIYLGVDRIGTSSAKQIVNKEINSNTAY